mmetsp:Transcript_9325/g.32909  ORF Transcript_9325/g.32909 Transcript_9325/m.32909 type:complete len:144 (-) Transcript_9325:592-1023(-)
MGGNFSFTANADSVSTPGAKCILSDKIDGVTAEKLFEGIEKYIRNGKTKAGQEAEFSVADEEGGVHVTQVFNVPELFGGGTYIMHNVYRFDPLKHRVEHDFFIGQTTSTEKHLCLPPWSTSCRSPFESSHGPRHMRFVPAASS